MKALKLNWMMATVVCGLLGLSASAASAPSPWEQPAVAMATQIAEILGPGQARLTIRNISSIPANEIPVIHQLIEQDLKAHGVLASGTESANEIRITLSENQRERLWVAEVIEGNETRVAMVKIEKNISPKGQDAAGLILRKQILLTSNTPVLGLLEKTGWLAVVEPDALVLYFKSDNDGWKESKRLSIAAQRAAARDTRGIIMPATVSNENGFEAHLAGAICNGLFAIEDPSGKWAARCFASDDPWPLVQPDAANSSPKAFYNSARNYFTGVVSPSLGVDLPPFYMAALLPRSADSRALLIGGIDGKVQLLENGALKQVSGARDWGSDFAVLHSGCGAGTQIIASGSGEAVSDSLRAYELPAQEAIPVSAALAVDGTVTALWAAPDGKSVFAVVRGATDQYEVDRVTATCN